jgi:hypothetical protein
MELVRNSRKPQRVNPKKMLIYANPKTGKTTIGAALTVQKNWVMLDFEKVGEDFGSDFVEGVIQPMDKGLSSLSEFIKAFKEAEKNEGKKPFEGIIVDSITALEELCIPYAGKIYRNSSMGKNWEEKDDKILELPNGAGYYWTRLAMKDILDKICSLTPHVIFLGHKSEKTINKKGTEINVREIALTGKLKSIVSADMDAIGYLYREEEKTILSFVGDETTVVGGRCLHLSDKEIEIATSESGEIVVDWSKIFIDEEK